MTEHLSSSSGLRARGNNSLAGLTSTSRWPHARRSRQVIPRPALDNSPRRHSAHLGTGFAPGHRHSSPPGIAASRDRARCTPRAWVNTKHDRRVGGEEEVPARQPPSHRHDLEHAGRGTQSGSGASAPRIRSGRAVKGLRQDHRSGTTRRHPSASPMKLKLRFPRPLLAVTPSFPGPKLTDGAAGTFEIIGSPPNEELLSCGELCDSIRDSGDEKAQTR